MWETPWQLEFISPTTGSPVIIPAQVPGNVLGDLERSGLIPDPYYAMNSLQCRQFEYIDFIYTSSFVTPDFVPGEKVELFFGGVDTVAEYYLDDQLLGKSCNMFIEQRLDISNLTHPGTRHKLKIILKSPINYARQFQLPAYLRAQDFNYESLYLRKARHSFGWDIFPRLVAGGLWREAGLEITPATSWQDVYLRTIRITPNGALLFLNWSFSTPEMDLDQFSAQLVLRCGHQEFIHNFKPRFICGATYMQIPDPQLWYPLGSGQQPLYSAELTLYKQQESVSVKNFTTAIRTVQVDYQEKARGDAEDRFDFIINGQKIYIKGINHVPVNALHGEKRHRRFQALAALPELNCNMIRIWGGGVYEDDDFYDWCDAHGVMVWQDFMFSCECPPQDDFYCQQVAEEAASIIKKLRHHPSLVIMCGDNECDVTSRSHSPKVKPSFNRITRQILPDAVASHAPEIPYLPSSPYISDAVWQSGGKFLPPEQHPWGDRYDWKSQYYANSFRCAMVSEVGYPALNDLQSLKKYLSPEVINTRDMALPHDQWLLHGSAPFADKHPSFAFRIPLLLKLVERAFGSIPEDFQTVIRESQIVQAEAMKSFVEAMRIQRNRCGGLLLWNLLDGWPQCSDALLDYYFVKQTAFDYVKCAQQDLCMILPEPSSWYAAPVMVNDRMTPAAGNWEIRDLHKNTVLAAGTYKIAAGSCCELKNFDHRPQGMQMLLLSWDDGQEHFCNHALLGHAPYDFDFYEEGIKKFQEYSFRIKSLTQVCQP